MATYVQFYTAAFENAKGEPTTRSVMEFFKRVEALGKSSVDLIDREINGNQYRISSYEWPDVGERFVIIPLGKVKHGAPYVEATDRKRLKELDQRVYDVNVLAYDTTYKTMLITNHQSAPTVNEIENYFNSFLLPNDTIRLRITPIVYNAGLERVQRADRVRNIAIELDLRAGTANLFRQHLDAPQSLIRYFGQVANKAKDDIMGNTLKLEIGLGQEKKKETLDKTALLDLIAELNIDSNAIKEIEVRYYGGEKDKCTVLNAWIEDVLTLAYSESRLTLIISATAIILGIYIAVISIIATSVLGITEDMIRKGKHEQLLHIVFTGMMVNSVLVFLCVLFDVDTGWKAVIISAFLSISIVSFFKFMWLLFLIFQANFLAMGKSIEEDRRENQELLTILNKIERKIKD